MLNTSKQPSSTAYLWRFLFIGLIIYALFYIFECFILIKYPYQISYGEGFILNQAALVSKGESIYQDITHYPFIVSNYPPVYPYLCALFVKLFAVSFSIGRLISTLATILSGVLIYIILKERSQLQKKWYTRPAIVSSLFLFASPYIFNYFPLFRADALALIFSLTGLYFVFKFETRKLSYLSIPFFILALYTKQNFVAAPIASIIYLFVKDTKKGLTYFIILSLIYISIFLLLNNITRGQFYLHTFVCNANIFSIISAIKLYIKTLQVHAILFGLSFVYVLHIILKRKLSLFALYFVITACVAFSVGKIGSNLNYFGEMIASSCILLGMFLDTPELNVKQNNNILVITGLLFQLVLFAHIPYLTLHTPTKIDLKNARETSKIIQDTQGPIISEDSGLLVLNRTPVVFQSFIFTQLANQGLWDQTKFVQDIHRGKFSLIILTFNLNYEFDRERLTNEMATAIKEHYYLQSTVGKYYLYRPNK